MINIICLFVVLVFKINNVQYIKFYLNNERVKNLKSHRANELLDMAEDKNFVILNVVKKLLTQQERSFHATVNVIIADIKEDVKTVKKELEAYRQLRIYTRRTKHYSAQTDRCRKQDRGISTASRRTGWLH